MSMVTDQKEFMVAGGQEVEGYQLFQEELYSKLIIEENREWLLATLFESETNELKELIDIIVVVLGKIISLGVDPQKAWDLVHANNMLKVTGKVVKDDNGKIVKSPEAIAAKMTMMSELEKILPKYQSMTKAFEGELV